MSLSSRYFLRFAAAFVRGRAAQGDVAGDPEPLLSRPLEDLTEGECELLFFAGQAAGLRMHKFKRAIELPRVRRSLGALRSLAPESLLDVGSGRGVFLWPLLDAFPELPVTTIDQS